MAERLDPVLLLHGQPGTARDWDRVVAALQRRAPGVRPLAIDRPGWDGRSRATGLRGNALAAVAALDAAAAQRATVVGHSFGGAVAAWLAAEAPARVGRLVLVAPSANAASLYRLDHWLATPLGDLIGAVTLASAGAVLAGASAVRGGAGAVRGGAGAAPDGPAARNGYLRATAGRLLAPASWRAFTVEQRALIRDLPALERRLATISAPTTIVVGSRDVVVPRAATLQLARQLPGAELRMIERAGHLLPLQQAEVLAGIILGLE
jgi:pimeloyl-ACP methyl ester carboxylesterase